MRFTIGLTLLAALAAAGCADGAADDLIGLEDEPLFQRAVVLPQFPPFAEIGEFDENENFWVCIKLPPEGGSQPTRRVIIKDDKGEDRDGDFIPDCPGGFDPFPTTFE